MLAVRGASSEAAITAASRKIAAATSATLRERALCNGNAGKDLIEPPGPSGGNFRITTVSQMSRLNQNANRGRSRPGCRRSRLASRNDAPPLSRRKTVESGSDVPSLSRRRVVWEYDGKGRRIRQTTYNGSGGSYEVTEELLSKPTQTPREGTRPTGIRAKICAMQARCPQRAGF
jgi:hypothetical protein